MSARRIGIRLLGGSGLRVSEICLGTMTFGDVREQGWGATKDEARRILDAYVEAGGSFLDTANNYAGGESERCVAELIADERDRYVVATKYSSFQRQGDPNSGGNHRKSLRQALDASLERLGTDYVDLLWVHAWDFVTPIDELMRALDDAVRSGKVLHIGFSDVPAWVVARANTLAELRGWTPFSAIQIEYSLIERTVERDLVPMAEALGLATLAWAPLGRGLLTGKYASGASDGAEPRRLSPGDSRLSERNLAIAGVVSELAQELGAAPAQVAVAWLMRRPAKVIPIVGARTGEQLRETLGCLELELSGEQLRRLDEATQVSLGFPHDFLAGLAARHAQATAGTRS